MARKRYQKGRLFLRGKRERVWVARWRVDEIRNGERRRRLLSKVIGKEKELTRKLAQRILDKLLIAVNDPNYRARPVATFEEFSETWKRDVLVNKAPSTQANAKSHLKKHLLPTLGKTRLSDIGPEDVQMIVRTLADKAPQTAWNVAMTLRSMWRTARAWGYVGHDVFDGVSMPAKEHAARRCFSVEEARRIIAAAEEPWKTFFWLVAEVGLRPGEACGLRVTDLDAEALTIRVEQAVWQGRLKAPKSRGSRRTLPISPALANHLRSFLEKWQPNRFRLLFLSETGKPLSGGFVLKKKLRPLLEELGMDGVLYSFRHGHATLLDQLGAPMKVRQVRLGHSDPRVTLGTYTHLGKEDFDVARKVGESLNPSEPKPQIRTDAPKPQTQMIQ